MKLSTKIFIALIGTICCYLIIMTIAVAVTAKRGPEKLLKIDLKPFKYIKVEKGWDNIHIHDTLNHNQEGIFLYFNSIGIEELCNDIEFNNDTLIFKATNRSLIPPLFWSNIHTTHPIEKNINSGGYVALYGSPDKKSKRIDILAHENGHVHLQNILADEINLTSKDEARIKFEYSCADTATCNKIMEKYTINNVKVYDNSTVVVSPLKINSRTISDHGLLYYYGKDCSGYQCLYHHAASRNKDILIGYDEFGRQ